MLKVDLKSCVILVIGLIVGIVFGYLFGSGAKTQAYQMGLERGRLEIEEKYQKHKKQILREGGSSGCIILILADIREEIKSNKYHAKIPKKCFKIFFENDIWIAVFLFQAFTKTPSKV